jgi:hypothetical protein
MFEKSNSCSGARLGLMLDATTAAMPKGISQNVSCFFVSPTRAGLTRRSVATDLGPTHVCDSMRAKMVDQVHSQDGKLWRARSESLERTITKCSTPLVVCKAFALCWNLDDSRSSTALSILLPFVGIASLAPHWVKNNLNLHRETKMVQVLFERMDQRRQFIVSPYRQYYAYQISLPRYRLIDRP